MDLIDVLKKVFGSSGGNTDQDKAPSDSATSIYEHQPNASQVGGFEVYDDDEVVVRQTVVETPPPLPTERVILAIQQQQNNNRE